MMKVPVSWLRDYVEIEQSIEELARQLTFAGLEVESIHYVGLPLPGRNLEGRSGGHLRQETKISGIEWDPEKIVVGAIMEVMPHPNADRLVLCRLEDGQGERTVLTGAPNLFDYKGRGPLPQSLKVAYAREGSSLYDGHKPGWELMTLKRTKIRGVVSDSMVCSEKELGISEEHEGIIILDDDAPVGVPLADYMGDAVLEIAITPNIARAASIVGVAREVAALTGASLRSPELEVSMAGPPIAGRAALEIRAPELNPRFVLGLVEEVDVRPSPYWAQRRLKLAGMRPINCIVDATNYAMLELGEPLHAFDYDVLVRRADGKAPTIITRTAEPGETLTTLDDVERKLDDFTVLVCDTAGALSIAGVMGGVESEVTALTRNVLLEGAAWNFINVRRTLVAQGMSSEAAYRFSRGVHPALAEHGVLRGLGLMQAWSSGRVAQGLVDNYPLPPADPQVVVTTGDVRRWLGIELSTAEMADILQRLEFGVTVDGDTVLAQTPPHRLDIGSGVIGKADLMEEIARVYGYDRIPETRLADQLPPQRSNQSLEREERLRDALAGLGLQEVITHRLVAPERERRWLPADVPPDDRPYVRLYNPISSDRAALRHSLLNSVLEIAERNARLRQQLALFEIAPIFLVSEDSPLPEENQRLVIALSGARVLPDWQGTADGVMDFYDLKGILEATFQALHVEGVAYLPETHPAFHPGKCAVVLLGEKRLGLMGELHPLVHRNYDLLEAPLLTCDLDLEPLLEAIPERYPVTVVPPFPPVLEDLAFVVDEEVPGGRVAELIREAGGQLVTDVRLFDLYRGAQAGPGKKSLAYSITYQAPDRTLTDEEAARVRQRIIRRLEQELNARLRS
jgi:phenylalanyl-tRNA synthetase beta chain